MSALDQMLDHVHRLTSNSGETWISTIELMLADEKEARAELAALRVRVAALEKAVEAGDIVEIACDSIAESLAVDSQYPMWIREASAATKTYRAAREASR